jgi:hypothetical protein
MKIIKWFLVGIVTLVVIVVLVGGYFGLVPGVNTIFGSNKPQDLGVVASAESFKTAIAKIGIVRDDVAAATSPSVTYQGSHSVNISLTSEEVSSLFQTGSWKKTWQFNPVADDFEMKISSGGGVEIAGLLDIKKLNGYLSATGFNDVLSYTSKFNFLPNEIPFYMSGSGGVTDNKVNLKMTEVEIGRISLPTDATAAQAVESFVERRIAGIPGMDIASLNFNGGKLNFQGTLPSTIKF